MLKKLFVCFAFIGFLVFAAPHFAQAGNVTGTINFVAVAANGYSWVNITTTEGWVLNYGLPTDQTNPFMAIALTAMSSSKQAIISSDSGDWSTMTAIMMTNTSAS